MKIHSLTGTIGYSNAVGDKQSGGSSQQRHSDHHRHNPEKENPEIEVEANTENIELAVEDFKLDIQTQGSGLSASMEGTGPGLKVVLKDAAGSVVRNFTGKEFLRLRQSTLQDHRKRGKILDQKL